jgi:spore protease
VGAMFVTPKDVDAVISRLSNIIANALNIVLHTGISKDDINRYMY